MDKPTEQQILYEKLILSFPNIITKVGTNYFVLYDFPNSRFKLTVTYRIDLQIFGRQYFEYFKDKISSKLKRQFPSIRFFWKDNEVLIYLEENGTKKYLTQDGITGFSSKFYDIIMALHSEISKLSLQ